MVLHLFYALKKIFHLLKKRRGANIAPFFFVPPLNFLHPLEILGSKFFGTALASPPLLVFCGFDFFSGHEKWQSDSEPPKFKKPLTKT